MTLEIFEEMVHPPFQFTLDWFLNLVPQFKMKYLPIHKLSQPKVDLKDVVQPASAKSFQVEAEDVDFCVPTIQVDYQGKKFGETLLVEV